MYILHLCHYVIFNFDQLSCWCIASAWKEILEIQKWRLSDFHYAIFLGRNGHKWLDYLLFSCYCSKYSFFQFRSFHFSICPYRRCHFYCIGCITMIILITSHPLLVCYEKIQLATRNVIRSMLSNYRLSSF